MSIIPPQNATDFSLKLIQWYHRHHRDLPWRHTTDPYKIWLSEVILQQTRVAQGLPYYVRFVEKFPTVFDLAAASQQEVLRQWQGLGYYSRARNMHETAQQVVTDFGGKFPDTYAELLKLKGVGSYTAAAIASFAFGEAVPAVDGNVFRVVSRIFGIKTDIAGASARKEFMQIVQQLIPAGDAATFNQAMIEFGAIQCQPIAPDCLLCPFNTLCYAFENGAQARLPVKTKKGSVRNRYFNYIVLEHKGRLAMGQRPAGDVWQGLFDFFLVESSDEAAEADQVLAEATFPDWARYGTLEIPRKTYIHLLSHQRLHVKFWHLRADTGPITDLPAPYLFYDPLQVEELPKPILIDTFIKEHFFS